jgi:hypothetical protein
LGRECVRGVRFGSCLSLTGPEVHLPEIAGFINDYKTALAILKDLAKLEKAYEHQRKRIQEAGPIRGSSLPEVDSWTKVC